MDCLFDIYRELLKSFTSTASFSSKSVSFFAHNQNDFTIFAPLNSESQLRLIDLHLDQDTLASRSCAVSCLPVVAHVTLPAVTTLLITLLCARYQCACAMLRVCVWSALFAVATRGARAAQVTAPVRPLTPRVLFCRCATVHHHSTYLDYFFTLFL